MDATTTTGLIRRENARRLIERLEAKPFLSSTDMLALAAAKKRVQA